jgi:hypothetical protein
MRISLPPPPNLQRRASPMRTAAFILPELIPPGSLKGFRLSSAAAACETPPLIRMLQDRAGFGTVCGHEDFGIDSSAKEPLAFAIARP